MFGYGRILQMSNKLDLFVHEPFYEKDCEYQFQPNQSSENWPGWLQDAFREGVFYWSREHKCYCMKTEKGLELFRGGTITMKRKIHRIVFPGKTAFKLQATHGLPIDIIAEVCREKDFVLDVEGYLQAMEEHQQKSQNKKFKKC